MIAPSSEVLKTSEVFALFVVAGPKPFLHVSLLSRVLNSGSMRTISNMNVVTAYFQEPHLLPAKTLPCH